MNYSRTALLCTMSTKCFHMQLFTSLTVMLIEGIRYFNKNQTNLPFIGNSKSMSYVIVTV